MRYKANRMGGEAAVRSPRKPGGGTRSAGLQKERRQAKHGKRREGATRECRVDLRPI